MIGHTVFLLLYFFIMRPHSGLSLSCFDCTAEDNSCDVGECQGATCLKMETSYIDNDGRKTVNKGCSEDYEETQCKQTAFGSTCDTEYCNGERKLVAAGIQTSSGIHKLIFHTMLSMLCPCILMILAAI